MSATKYPPRNALAEIKRLAAKGWSTVLLAKHFGVSRSTLKRWFDEDENGDFEEAFVQGRASHCQMIQDQIFKMGIEGKNPAGLIYLSKSKYKHYDVPNKNDTNNIGVNVEPTPVLVVKDHGTVEEWAAKAAEQQRRLTAPTIDAVITPPIYPAQDKQPKLTAPAWIPKKLR